MREGRRWRTWALSSALTLGAVGACRMDYERLADDSGVSLGGLAGSGGSGSGSGSGGLSGASGGAGPGGTNPGGAAATGGSDLGGAASGGLGGAAPSGGSSAMGGSTAEAACGNAPFEELWTFTTGIDAWTWGVNDTNDGTMSWTAAAPDSPAMQVDTALEQLPKLDLAPIDLTGRVVSVRVYLESGTPTVKLFAQSGDAHFWADAGARALTAGQWTCLQFDLASPDSGSSSFDSTDIRALGVQIQTTDTSRVYLDDFAY